MPSRTELFFGSFLGGNVPFSDLLYTGRTGLQPPAIP
jgi:hypothetical protein